VLYQQNQFVSNFGLGSEFGFEKTLLFFELLPAAQETDPTKFGIRSVSVTLPHPTRKTRYLSSAYCPGSALSKLLIIGRSKVQILLGPPFSIDFRDL
jgi:hypothetical protein